MAGIGRALLSVSDKTGIVDLARALADRGVEIVSTGGTAAALKQAGIACTDVSAVTGFPEIMGGRVKTLHPLIHGGLLGRRENDADRAAMADHSITGIDLVAVNLYPFEQVAAAGAGWEEAVETTDIGGPAMIRAAAKNHAHVTVIVDPADYDRVLAEIAGNDGTTTLSLRRELAAKAFARTAQYDAAIAAWYADALDIFPPATLTVTGTLVSELRYGENPHQQAAFYRTGEDRPGVATARLIKGKTLSYNNINDTDAAFELLAEIGDGRAAIVIVKHANPCGVALGDTLREAYRAALRCDPVSAFGGIVAANRPLDHPAAIDITDIFTEVVIAPGADADALRVFAEKPNLRLLLTDGLPDPAEAGLSLKTVAGGLLVQDRDDGRMNLDDLRTVTRRAPTEQELADLLFAFRIAKHVKSNTIVYAKQGATVGIGAGQMSRVDAARIAARKAVDAAEAEGLDVALPDGSVVASDAFFPFADGMNVCAEAGATAVIQPGGSVRDEEVIEAADRLGLAMVFTGQRHFRH